jgi:hypothetical protein
VKAKGHLEFCQWFKRYFELNYKADEPYDAVKKRKGKELYYIMDSRQQKVEPKKEKSANPGFLRKITQKFTKKKKEPTRESESKSKIPRASARGSQKKTERAAPTRAGKRASKNEEKTKEQANDDKTPGAQKEAN